MRGQRMVRVVPRKRVFRQSMRMQLPPTRFVVFGDQMMVAKRLTNASFSILFWDQRTTSVLDVQLLVIARKSALTCLGKRWRKPRPKNLLQRLVTLVRLVVAPKNQLGPRLRPTLKFQNWLVPLRVLKSRSRMIVWISCCKRLPCWWNLFGLAWRWLTWKRLALMNWPLGCWMVARRMLCVKAVLRKSNRPFLWMWSWLLRRQNCTRMFKPGPCWVTSMLNR